MTDPLQTYLKEPAPRFALVLDDRQLALVEQLLREELKIYSSTDAETRKRLKHRIKVCREILGKIDSIKKGTR